MRAVWSHWPRYRACERYAFEQVDICDRIELDRVFALHQPDAVMHLAAEVMSIAPSPAPAAFIETNIVGTCSAGGGRAYWNGLGETRKAAFRFHHISTDEVYGDLPHPVEFLLAPRGEGAGDEGEQTSLLPKLPMRRRAVPILPPKASERPSGTRLAPYLRARRPSSPIAPITTVPIASREADPAGDPQRLGWQAAARLWRGDQIRDWLYVEDHARALCKGGYPKARLARPTNIGGHNEKQNLEVVHIIRELFDEMVPWIVRARVSPSPLGRGSG